MTRKRGTKKPCPGCGEEVWRNVGDVCRGCRDALNRVEAIDAQLAELSDDEIIVYFGRNPHWNEYISAKAGTSRNLMDIFHRVAIAGSSPSLATYSEFALLGKTDGISANVYAKMNRSLAEAIRELRVAVQDALKKEYETGKRDGHNLLIRLASGDLAMNEFDKAVK